MTRISVILCFSIWLTAKSVNCESELTFGQNCEDEKQPIILKNGDRFKDNKIEFKNGDTVSFVCPGPNNEIKRINSYVTTPIRIYGDTIKGGNVQVKPLSYVQCKNRITAQPKNLNQRCSGVGTFFEIRFRQDLPLLRVCYDLENMNPLYSQHKIEGNPAYFSTTSNLSPSFSTQELPETAIDSLFTTTRQKARLSQIFKDSTKASEYINTKSFLARGHLATKTHFAFSFEQYATYFYLNVVPQWQQCNNANWKSVESTIKSFIELKKGVFDIITGTHDVFTIKDENNNLSPIYLNDGNKIPIPKYIWKIVYQTSTKAAIVFIQINDPFIKAWNHLIFCTDVCKDSRFYKENWSKPEKGIIFCCELEDFRKKVKTVPDITASRLLTNDVEVNQQATQARKQISSILDQVNPKRRKTRKAETISSVQTPTSENLHRNN